MPPLAAPLWWLRGVELSGLADGAAVTTWAAAPGSTRKGSTLIGDITKRTLAGVVYARALKETNGAAAELISDPILAVIDGDFTAYMVVLPTDASAGYTPSGATWGPASEPSATLSVRDTLVRSRIGAGAGDIVQWVFSSLPAGWSLWSVRRRGRLVELRLNGLLVASTSIDPTPRDGRAWEVFPGALPDKRATGLGELLVLPYATDDASEFAWLSYFHARFPSLPYPS